MPKIRYTLSMPEPQTHLYQVRMDIEGLRGEHVDLVMPVWTPGAYAVRDFARHVQDFEAGPMAWTKVEKSRWRVRTRGSSKMRVTYRVWAYELEVDRSHLDDTHGYFNGAGVFMYIDGAKHEPVTLDIQAPRGWRVTTGLERVRGSRFAAANYDELIDCPTDVGTAPVRTFRVRGKEHQVLIHGPNNWDHDRVTRHAQKIVVEHARLFGGLPYRHYTFLYFASIGPHLGGLEHHNSTAITLNPWIGRPFKSYERLLEVTSHEFFHLWNVKRIKPKALGPFNYERETYTRLLWVAEGLTSYYDDLICERAGLYPQGRYLKKLAEGIHAYREKPSRQRQSLTQSSFDTWLWKYEGDGNIINRMMSYYEKGALVGLCLDLEIRHRTRNRRSLDDIMRFLWTDFAKKGRRLEEDEFRSVVEGVAGGSYRDFFDRYVDGVDEVPFEVFLRHAGLELTLEPPKGEDAKDEPKEIAWLGLSTRSTGERPAVTTVTEGSPAWKHGISPEDEIVALNGARVIPENFATLLKDHPPGVRITLSLFRGPRLVHLPITLGRKPNAVPALKARARARALERAIYRGWVRKKWPPPPPPLDSKKQELPTR
ncbi:MAG: M61 family metallopeptidase [Planctomycetes bacterium]|nr:M61 family metallopeptidase [Planctomycetota bacterium]